MVVALSRLSNSRLKLTRGEGCSHAGGAHPRALRARGVVSRRAQLNRVFCELLKTGCALPKTEAGSWR